MRLVRIARRDATEVLVAVLVSLTEISGWSETELLLQKNASYGPDARENFIKEASALIEKESFLPANIQGAITCLAWDIVHGIQVRSADEYASREIERAAYIADIKRCLEARLPQIYADKVDMTPASKTEKTLKKWALEKAMSNDSPTPSRAPSQRRTSDVTNVSELTSPTPLRRTVSRVSSNADSRLGTLTRSPYDAVNSPRPSRAPSQRRTSDVTNVSQLTSPTPLRRTVSRVSSNADSRLGTHDAARQTKTLTRRSSDAASQAMTLTTCSSDATSASETLSLRSLSRRVSNVSTLSRTPKLTARVTDEFQNVDKRTVAMAEKIASELKKEIVEIIHEMDSEELADIANKSSPVDINHSLRLLLRNRLPRPEVVTDPAMEPTIGTVTRRIKVVTMMDQHLNALFNAAPRLSVVQIDPNDSLELRYHNLWRFVKEAEEFAVGRAYLTKYNERYDSLFKAALGWLELNPKMQQMLISVGKYKSASQLEATEKLKRERQSWEHEFIVQQLVEHVAKVASHINFDNFESVLNLKSEVLATFVEAESTKYYEALWKHLLHKALHLRFLKISAEQMKETRWKECSSEAQAYRKRGANNTLGQMACWLKYVDLAVAKNFRSLHNLAHRELVIQHVQNSDRVCELYALQYCLLPYRGCHMPTIKRGLSKLRKTRYPLIDTLRIHVTQLLSHWDDEKVVSNRKPLLRRVAARKNHQRIREELTYVLNNFLL